MTHSCGQMELSQTYLRGQLWLQTTLPSCSCPLPPVLAGEAQIPPARSPAASLPVGSIFCPGFHGALGFFGCRAPAWIVQVGAEGAPLTPQLSSGDASVAGLCCWCLLCSKAGCRLRSASLRQEQASGVRGRGEAGKPLVRKSGSKPTFLVGRGDAWSRGVSLAQPRGRLS